MAERKNDTRRDTGIETQAGVRKEVEEDRKRD